MEPKSDAASTMCCDIPDSSSSAQIGKCQSLDSPGPGDPETEAWLWDWPTNTIKLFEQEKEFEFAKIECWNYEDDKGNRTTAPITRYEVDTLQMEPILSWMEEHPPVRDGQRPSSGFKIMAMPCNEDEQIPHLTAEQNNLINTAFGLPNFQTQARSMDCGACGMFLQSDNSYVFIIRGTLDTASITTALRYDPHTNVTRGVFYFDLKIFGLEEFKKMPAQFIKCSHPLLIQLLAIELTVKDKTSRMDYTSSALLSIERQTGYGLNVSQNRLGLEDDFRALVQKLGQAQSSVYLSLATITTCRLSTQFTRQKLHHLNQFLPGEYQRKLKPFCGMLEERIDFLLSNMEHAYVYSSLKERMQSQQTVLFNLIAQSDSQINLELAKDSRETAIASKQDSSAMKIIALLTTFFLPGTFVATFFAMPLFNWSEPSISQVANRHFWIYWAVTGPLTLTIMASVVTWALWHNRHVELLQSRARDSVGTKTAMDEGQGTNEEREPGTVGVSTPAGANRNKYSLLTIFKRRRRYSRSSTTEP